jgi:hypothetical protein
MKEVDKGGGGVNDGINSTHDKGKYVGYRIISGTRKRDLYPEVGNVTT